MSIAEEFRHLIESLISNIEDCRYHRGGFEDSEQPLLDLAICIHIALAVERELDRTPVKPPELREIAGQILAIPLVRRIMAEHPDVRAIDYAFESGDVDSLEAKLREMLEYLPTPKAQDASPGRTLDQTGLLAQSRRRRGPKPDMARHQKIAAVVEPYGQAWKQERNLQEIARRLDQEHVGVRKSWTELEPQAVRSWKRAATSKPDLVIKAIDYSLSVVSRSPR